ncbi:MAG: hypothetical protein H6869_01820 [Rhodospirillales bacterium]|nr:hypothetical protein [Rhodospirillales bacterium]
MCKINLQGISLVAVHLATVSLHFQPFWQLVVASNLTGAQPETSFLKIQDPKVILQLCGCVLAPKYSHTVYSRYFGFVTEEKSIRKAFSLLLVI